MGGNLAGADARIWELHSEGFCASRIAGLVGVAEDRARTVITGEWRGDKPSAKAAGHSSEGRFAC